MFKRILCPMDGSEHSLKALTLATDLASRYEAKLVLAHVTTRQALPEELMHYARIEGIVPESREEIDRLQGLGGHLEYRMGDADAVAMARVSAEVGEQILGRAKRKAEAAGLEKIETVLLDGDAGPQILRCIDERDVDCVVMGSRGLSDLKSLFMGSVSHKVANHAACTCIAVK